jgi:succinate dehydrogenase/fumarate reductase flavoprotein subunit
MELLEADVVVVGFGNAALAAAITASDAGASVIMLEKMDEERSGGNSRVSGQVWFNPDESAGAVGYLEELNQEMSVPGDVVATWSEEIVKNTAWIEDRAAEADGQVVRDADDPYGQGAEITKINYHDEMLRMTGWEASTDEYPEFNNECGTDYYYLGPSQGYSRLWRTLRGALETRDVAVHFGTRAVGLTRNPDGRVAEVHARSDSGEMRISARRGVVLAAGGFENNQDMVRSFLGLPFGTPWGSPGNTGDGIKLAQTLGADLQNMYNYMPFMGIKVPGREVGEFVQPAGLGFMYVRKDGRRFIDETTPYRHGKVVSGGSFQLFPHQPMWTVFDETVRLAGPLAMRRENFAGGWLKQVERYEWSEDNSREIEAGWIAKGDTIGELAANLGIDPAGLEAEIALYNEDCSRGADSAFGRPGAALAPIDAAPYYGYRWGNMMIATMGGLKKDGQARVIDVNGHPIDGLYCAGEISSTYPWALSGGMGIGDALAFGRVAGRNVATKAPLASKHTTAVS